jgi:hypothetical protein
MEITMTRFLCCAVVAGLLLATASPAHAITYNKQYLCSPKNLSNTVSSPTLSNVDNPCHLLAVEIQKAQAGDPNYKNLNINQATLDHAACKNQRMGLCGW